MILSLISTFRIHQTQIFDHLYSYETVNVKNACDMKTSVLLYHILKLSYPFNLNLKEHAKRFVK